MDNYIILSFIYNDKQIFNNIFIYCNRFEKISKSELNKYINNLIKNNIIIDIGNKLELSIEGKYRLNILIIYYKRKIVEFYKTKTNKKYALKVIRKEQTKLRNYLIENHPNICLFCDKKLPYFLLETAHIKPRCLLKSNELLDYNNVILLCRFCHIMFDRGLLGIHNNKLLISPNINLSEYDLPKYKENIKISDNNKCFFEYHYKFIYNS